MSSDILELISIAKAKESGSELKVKEDLLQLVLMALVSGFWVQPVPKPHVFKSLHEIFIPVLSYQASCVSLAGSEIYCSISRCFYLFIYIIMSPKTLDDESFALRKRQRVGRNPVNTLMSSLAVGGSARVEASMGEGRSLCYSLHHCG